MIKMEKWKENCPMIIDAKATGVYREWERTHEVMGCIVKYVASNIEPKCSFECTLNHGCNIKTGD